MTPNRHRAKVRKLIRAAIVIVGLVISQALLIGPSLIGRQILLPLDLLQPPPCYLPSRLWNAQDFRGDFMRTDPVLQLEPNRLFAVHEVRAGRLPLWNPYSYCGAPFLAANQPAVFSPFRLLDYLWPSPVAIAWGQMLRALVAGGGAYLFFRRVMRLRFLPSTLAAWCYPIGGFLTLWTGYLQASEVTWFPLLLLATYSVIRPRRFALRIVGLSLVTAAVLLSGHSATGTQMLVFSGFFALWAIHHRFGRNALLSAAGLKVCGALLIGWIVGAGLSMPQTLPTLQYIHDSARIASRAAGFVESPPDGFHALPQLVVPYFFGGTAAQRIYLLHTNMLEGLSAGYAGLVLTMVVAPFAWLSRRHRGQLIFWGIAGIVGVGYIIDVPGLAIIYRAPLINTLRNNRLTFISGFAILCWGAAGMNALLRRRTISPKWMFAAGAVVILGLMCLYRTDQFSPQLTDILNQLQQRESAGQADVTLQSDLVSQRFITENFHAVGWCAAAIASLALAVFLPWRKSAVMVIGTICIAELLITARQIDLQGDPTFYYPRLPVFDAISAKPPGRVCGAMCLPAALNLVYPLPDVRGYDAADPIEITQLLERIVSPQAPRRPYALTQWFFPDRDSPVLDLLNLRYVIGFGPPPPGMKVAWSDGDYFFTERPSANTRVFVPSRIETIADGEARLTRITDSNWNPRDSLILESDTESFLTSIHGEAKIVRDEPAQVEIDTSMSTPGYVLLADRWDPGWRATVNGQPAVVLRGDHAFRAVRVPAGASHIVYRYLPATFTVGCYLAAASAVFIGGLCWLARPSRRSIPPPPA